jgi:hypothetical protein
LWIGRNGVTHSRKFVATLACCVAASALVVGHAAADQGFDERFHDEGSVEIEDFCGTEGLTLSDDFVRDAKVRTRPHGPDRFPYYLAHFKETEVLTNLANRKTVTLVNVLTEKELKVTNNRDGTLTILLMGTGNTVLYGADGKAIARNPGQSRFELLIDHGGKPTDPSDDELISAERVKGSTGRNDDVCAATVEALT